MLCEKCGKNVATTHIRTVINGVKTEKHLCADCAAKEGNSFDNISLNGMLASMFGDALSLNPSNSLVRCACCGSTFADISESGKAGCPECYKTFYKEFLPYIKRVHGADKHIGKSANTQKSEESGDTLFSLKRELENLVKEEKYEEAAKLRDKIREMEAEK